MQRFRGGIVGMDVDRGAIKAVQITGAAEGYVLQHVGYHRLPEGVILDGEVVDVETLAAEIREFWDLHSFKGKSVALGVAGRSVIVRFVDFPRLSPEDLDSAMSFHAEEHIPMPLDEVVLDHVVLGPSGENPEEDRVLLVAAHRDLIGGYTRAVRSGGLKPAGIDVKALSLARSTLPADARDDETVLLLDIGTELSNLAVIQNGMPTLTQFVPLGFVDFSEAVARAADLESDEAETQVLNDEVNIDPSAEDYNVESEAETQALEPTPGPDGGEIESRDQTPEAEEAVDEPGDRPAGGEEATGRPVAGDGRGQEGAPPDTPEAEGREMGSDPALIYDVRRGLEDAARRLAVEVQRSVEYHNSRSQSREVSRVLVSGEGALIHGIEAYLGELLGIAAERARPTGRLSANRSNISDEQLSAMEPVLAIALGLAMEDQ